MRAKIVNRVACIEVVHKQPWRAMETVIWTRLNQNTLRFVGSVNLGLLAMFLSPTIAQAQLTICNPTKETVAVAINHGSTFEGWWVLEPSKCKVPFKSALQPGEIIGIYTEPATTVPNATRWANGFLGACVQQTEFTFTSIEIGCPPPKRSVGFRSYQVAGSREKWNLAIDPNPRPYRGRGMRIAGNLPEGLRIVPMWTASVGRTNVTLTSASGRKEKTWDFDAPAPGEIVCTYRVHERVNIGGGNHWHLDRAYSSARLRLSVKPGYTSVGVGMAEVYDGGKARLDLLLDWYLVYPAPGVSRNDAIRQVNEVLSLHPEVLAKPENERLRHAFNNRLWPSDVRCHDAPQNIDRHRKDPVPPGGVVFTPLEPTFAATMLVSCVRKDDGQYDGAQVYIKKSAASCELARSAAHQDYAKQECGAQYPNRRNGPWKWLQTSSCPAQ